LVTTYLYTTERLNSKGQHKIKKTRSFVQEIWVVWGWGFFAGGGVLLFFPEMRKEKPTCLKQAFSLSENTWVAIAKALSRNRPRTQHRQQSKLLAYTVRRAAASGRRTRKRGST